MTGTSDSARISVAHAFILHGNVRDYMETPPYFPLTRFLTVALGPRSDIIIQIDPASGLDIPVPAHRELLVRLMTASTSVPQVPFAQALRQTGAGQPSARTAAPFSFRDVTAFLDWLLVEPLMLPHEPSQTPGSTVAAEKRRVRVSVIFDYSEFMLPDAEITKIDPSILTRIIRWAQLPAVGEHHLLVMLAESLSALHSEIRRASARWEAIELPLPTVEVRQRFVQAKLEQMEADELSRTADLTAQAIAHATGGLTLLQIEDILFRGLGSGQLTLGMISERKQTIIKKEFADVIQISDARLTLDDVGGYDYLKQWLEKTIVRAWRGGKLQVGGILMSGPPGTGKTQLAEAMAGSAGLPFVVFRLSKILGQFVGNSERNLERALHALMSLAPVLVFIDEIDQTVRRGEAHDGSGVDNRVFARLLEFMEDPARRGKILIVAATNRPDLLDLALRSRFDRTLPVLPPTAEDRANILYTLAKSRGIRASSLGEKRIGEAVTRTEGWTGRNLRDLMSMVAELMDDDGMAAGDALQEAVSLYIPPLRDLEQQTRLALQDITDLRLVPPQFREQLHQAPVPGESERTEPERSRQKRVI